MKKKEILERWYREVWQNGNLDIIDEVFAPDNDAKLALLGVTTTRADIAEFVSTALMLLSDIKPTIIQSVEQGDWLAARIRVNANRADTGEPIEVFSHITARFKDDRIVEKQTLMDFFSLFEQLGQLPPEALAVCLTGQRLDWV